MTDSLREEVSDFIEVGVIIPGFVRSDLTAQIGHLAMDADEFAGIIVPQIEAGEFLEKRETLRHDRDACIPVMTT